MEIKPVHKGSCHCGRVEFEVNLPNGFTEPPYRCNCSFCRRRGAIAVGVPLTHLKVIKGEAFLTQYQFKSNTAKHYFCSVCGIYTHHQRRSDSTTYGFNLGCLEGVNPFELEDVIVYDGINHPRDRDTA